MAKFITFALLFFGLFFCSSLHLRAQTTAFTFQGSLQSSGLPVNGNYDFEFRLFDLAVSGGTQQGSTQQRLNVAVVNGIFTVTLDFGAGTLPGADRFLEISVRTAGGPTFTQLSPRQQVNSAPYSVKSLNSTNADTATNATQLGGVAANQYVVTTDPRMTDARDPLPSSANYIWNQNSVLQPSSNFVISGNGDVGTTSPAADLHIVSNGGNIVLGDPGCPSGSTAIGFNGPFNNCLNYSIRGDGTALYINRPSGGDILFREENGTTQMRLRSGGEFALTTLGAGGATPLCRNASNDISTCGSSMRYKTNVSHFGFGLNLVEQLQPIKFDWKQGGMHDLGLGAEDVAAIEPLLVTYNDKGEVEGVKYDRIGVVLVNAVKEQQSQIETLQRTNAQQQTLIETLQRQIDVMKKFICVNNKEADLCKE